MPVAPCFFLGKFCAFQLTAPPTAPPRSHPAGALAPQPCAQPSFPHPRQAVAPARSRTLAIGDLRVGTVCGIDFEYRLQVSRYLFGTQIRMSAERAKGSRQARVPSVELSHAWLQGAGATLADDRRCHQCRLSLSRSPLFVLRYQSNDRAGHHSAGETTPVHELERYMRCKDCSEVGAGLFHPQWPSLILGVA